MKDFGIEELKLFEIVIEKSPDGVLIANVKTKRFIFANHRICEITGYPLKELLKLDVTKIHPKENLPYVIDQFTKQVQEKITLAKDIPVLRKDKKVVYCDVNSKPIKIGEQEFLVGFFRDISKRKKAEETLRESEQKFRNLVETTTDWMWEVDKNGVYTYVSPKVKDILGYEPKEIIGKTPFDLMPKDEAKRIAKIFGKIAKKKESFSRLENWNVHKNRTKVLLETNGIPILDEKRNLIGYRRIDRDITERKKMGKELQKEKEKWASLTENTDDVIMIADNKGIIQYINKTLGNYTSEKTIGTPLYNYVPKEQVNIMMNHIEKVFKTGKVDSYEIYSNIPKVGTMWFNTKIVPIKSDKEIKSVILISTNVTERKKTEEELKESEEKYRLLVEQLLQKIFLKDRNSVYISCNENYAKDLKIKSNEIVGKTDYDFYPKKLAEKYRLDDKKVLKSGITKDIEEEYIQDGKKAFVHTVKTPLKDAKGNIIGILGIFWDITERKKADEALRKAKGELQSKVEELERFTRLAVGRELKMIELKKRIEELEEKLNK